MSYYFSAIFFLKILRLLIGTSNITYVSHFQYKSKSVTKHFSNVRCFSYYCLIFSCLYFFSETAHLRKKLIIIYESRISGYINFFLIASCNTSNHFTFLYFEKTTRLSHFLFVCIIFD